MNKAYLLKALDAYQREKGEPHPMADKCINLIWVKLPTKDAFERLSGMVNDPKYFNKVPIKLETASSGIGTWMASFKDIFWGMKFILVPAMIGIMSLVVANAISISVRERRTEMAVLKVLGFQPRHVLLLVLGEALLVGFLAGGMSSFLAWGMLGSFKFQIMFFGAFYRAQSRAGLRTVAGDGRVVRGQHRSGAGSEEREGCRGVREGGVSQHIGGLMPRRSSGIPDA